MTLWKVVPKQALVESSADLSTRVVPKQAPKLVPKQAHTKENKETIQKKEIRDWQDRIDRLRDEVDEAGRLKRGRGGPEVSVKI